MKIKIKKDALTLYIRDNTDWQGHYYGQDQWEVFLANVAGLELEVDEENLFKYEYDVLPVHGITKSKIRVLDDYVEKVIDDERIGKAKCDFCNNVSLSTDVCTSCGRSDYLENF
ncbi:hypothetical protein [Planococcus halocryophilus]|uniref:hypothetical protein n=1 Tax=Planococcus halocryophilus TaxID=1215089 RepID=UPI001F0D4951|nr:hypothetical protein [Planococcus halocryophilus]MCH4825181.1 hypothetical protein [Planococcus halocryophilus]